MTALLHDIFLFEKHALVEIGIEGGFHQGVRTVRSPAHKMGNGLLRTVGVIYLDPVTQSLHIVADSLETVSSLPGQQGSGCFIAVDPTSNEVVGTEISYLQNHIRDHLGDLHEIVTAYGKTGELFAGCRHVLLEFRAGLKAGETNAGGHAAGINIALPMGAGYDTAVAIFPCP